MLRLRPRTRLDRPDDFAWVCAVAGGLCILIHLLTLGSRDAIRALGFAPSGAPIYTLLTSMFVHASWGHLFGNMLFLLWYGPPVERTLGHRKTLLLYLGSGLAGDLIRYVYDGASTIPAVGASGAICGLLGAFGYIFRRERTEVAIGPWWFDLFTVECSVLTTILVFLILQAVLLLITAAAGVTGGVGYDAHVTGLVVGVGTGIFVSRQREAMLARWRREHAPDIRCPTCAGEARFAVDDLYRCRACGKWTHGPRPEEAAG